MSKNIALKPLGITVGTLVLVGGAVAAAYGALRLTGYNLVIGYKNFIPYPLLVKQVDNGVWLSTAAADAWNAMRAAAYSESVQLTAGSGFRWMSEQMGLWLKKVAGLYAPAVAKPGTSNHQQGRAIDVVGLTPGSPAFKWMLVNAGKYGYSWDEGKSVNEPWHWRYID